MIWGRTWKPEPFIELYGTHPVLRELAQGILWAAHSDDEITVVRFGADHSFSTVDDEPYERPIDAISVAHPVYLNAGEAATSWRSRRPPAPRMNSTVPRCLVAEVAAEVAGHEPIVATKVPDPGC